MNEGTYAQDHGWEYARDTHGGVCNFNQATVAILLGEKAVMLGNKCWRQIGETSAIYNHNGNFRLMVKEGK